MYFLAFLATTMVAFMGSVSAQPIRLLPGETLLSVDGVPMQRAAKQPAAARRVGSDQARAQAEANYMAARGIKGHVGGCIGLFEGAGFASHSQPSTCTPRRRMRLTADARARGRDGWYRVRAWR